MDSLLATVSLTLFLLPCAIQDWRSHQVSNWLTVPAFAMAWVAAFAMDNILFTASVFVGFYLAWHIKGAGAADGKVATLVAAIAPNALAFAGGLLGITFLLLRLIGYKNVHLPTVVWLWMGSLLYAILLSASISIAQSWYAEVTRNAVHLSGMAIGCLLMIHLTMALYSRFSDKVTNY